jgi:2-(1,2-epoxy-1,2-dihydrophenyl)acetyl-CoA isomerase
MTMRPDPTATDEVLYSVDGHVATITLNAPERLNAFGPELLGAWAHYIRQSSEDDNVRVVIVTGTGRAFCAGGNVRRRAEMGARTEAPRSAIERRNGLRLGVHRVPQALQYLDKPYIAAVNGAAAGGGMDMAMQADIRFASDQARFGMSYVNVGLAPGDGGCWLLPRYVGIAKALHLIWTGEMIDAQEALRLGLVSRVIPHDSLMAETLAYAHQLAEGPPIAMQMAKRLVYLADQLSFVETLDVTQFAMTVVQSTDDSREGPLAFAEKRKPEFKGR